MPSPGSQSADSPKAPHGVSGPLRWLSQSAMVAGLLALLVGVAMLILHFRARTQDPFKSPQLAELKQTLAEHPKDEALKTRIRTLDLELRRRYFRQLSLNRSGAWLVLGAAVFFLACARQARAVQAATPMPGPKVHGPDPATRLAVWSRFAVSGFAGLTFVALGLAVFTRATPLPPDAAGVEKLLSASGQAGGLVDFASSQEMKENWPHFRGPTGDGVSVDTNAPTAWDAKTGAGIAWSVPVPVHGFNSPIVWGDRVFMSGGDAAKREVVCFSGTNGQLLWRQAVVVASPASAVKAEIPEQTGYAASTMATDGRRVYAIFANGDVAAFTLEGKQAWAKNLGFPKNPHGHASSLMTVEGRLIVQLDQADAEQGLSKLMAFDGASGRVAWQRNRPVAVSWATPLLVAAPGKSQIVTLAVPWVISYAARDGAELWRAEGLNNEVTPSPIFAGGLVLAVSPNEKIMAIRPDGQGDVTKSHVAWEAEDNIPDITSPVSNGELVFAVTTPGMLTCYDARTGKKQWEQDLGMECNASPTLVGDKLYVVTIKGSTLVLDAGRAFREIARNDLGENVYATPAFVRGRIFVRGAEHLFCIGQTGAMAQTSDHGKH